MAVTVLLWMLAAALMLGGLIGLVAPALPGGPLLFAGVLVAAWAEGFAYIGWGTLTVLGLLAVLTILVDFIAGALGAKRYGASARSITGATIGGVVGLFFGLVGVVLGPFVGAVIGELSARRGVGAASRAGVGATLGFILGSAAKLAIGFTMIGIALVVRFL
jgi:uncharacterized protein YqgC (DUF456 family)